MREIPATAIEVQTGLWAEERTVTLGSMTITKYNLYSAEGYCFYIINANLDENGSLRPKKERIYAQFASTPYKTIEQINAKVVSVVVRNGYENVDTSGSDPEATPDEDEKTDVPATEDEEGFTDAEFRNMVEEAVEQ